MAGNNDHKKALLKCAIREQVFTLNGTDHAYRVIVEEISEAAATLSLDGTILFCNGRFSELVKAPPDHAIGASLAGFVGDPYQNR